MNVKYLESNIGPGRSMVLGAYRSSGEKGVGLHWNDWIGLWVD